MNQVLVLIKSDFKEITGIKASVQDKIYIKDVTIPIERGDIFEYKLPSGINRRLHVIKVTPHILGSNLDHYEIEYQDE